MSNFKFGLMVAAMGVVVSGCHTVSTAGLPATGIQITGHGSDRPDPICENFRMTPEQAKRFFDKARPITGEQLHEFDYLPCWVEGVTVGAGGTSKWRIHPVGVAQVTRPDGKVEMVGCRECEELFR